jgi:hypothetical protein
MYQKSLLHDIFFELLVSEWVIWRRLIVIRVGLRNVGVLGSLTIWCPLKPIFFKFFGPEKSWQTFLRAHAQIAGYLPEKLFCMCKPDFVAPYFQLFQSRLSVLIDWRTRRLAHPLDQPRL